MPRTSRNMVTKSNTIADLMHFMVMLAETENQMEQRHRHEKEEVEERHWQDREEAAATHWHEQEKQRTSTNKGLSDRCSTNPRWCSLWWWVWLMDAPIKGKGTLIRLLMRMKKWLGL